MGVEKHLLGFFSFSASLCSNPSQNPKITRILLAYPPTSFHSERKVWGVVDLGRPEGAEQLVKTLNRAKCQQWGGLGFQGCTS